MTSFARCSGQPPLSLRFLSPCVPSPSKFQILDDKLLRRGTGSLPGGTLGAESPDNEFAFAKNSLTEGARGRFGHLVPLQVLNIAATVADEMVMARAFRIESRGAPFHGYFTHQTCPHQITQIVIRRGPGRARILAIDGFEDFGSRRMSRVFLQECHHSVPLCSTPQAAGLQGPLNRPGVHEQFILYLI